MPGPKGHERHRHCPCSGTSTASIAGGSSPSMPSRLHPTRHGRTSMLLHLKSAAPTMSSGEPGGPACDNRQWSCRCLRRALGTEADWRAEETASRWCSPEAPATSTSRDSQQQPWSDQGKQSNRWHWPIDSSWGESPSWAKMATERTSWHRAWTIETQIG